jgi:small nuclear ribonucleoprotein (snRNP)-like protein
MRFPTTGPPQRVKDIHCKSCANSCTRTKHRTKYKMAGFVGSAVIVTLKQGAVIQGFVQAVDPTSASLVLQDGMQRSAMQRRYMHVLTTSSISPQHWPASGELHSARARDCGLASCRSTLSACAFLATGFDSFDDYAAECQRN